jgi:hypothetical protein
LIYLGGFSDAERQQFRDICHSHVVATSKALLAAVKQFEYKIDKANDKHVAAVDAAALGTELDEPLAKAIHKLWRDAAVQSAFARYAEFQLSDSAKYYMDAVLRLAAPDYVPTDEDILRVRAKTTGITEITFHVEQQKFRLVDVGGQRSERKKWMHCFPAADSELLTNRGFLLLDDVLAHVAWHRTAADDDDDDVVVTDWRGLEVATYDVAADALVYKQPNALVVNAAAHRLASFKSASGALDVVATDDHQLFVRTAGRRRFRKATGASLLAGGGAVTFLTAAEHGAGASKQQQQLCARFLAAEFAVHGADAQAAFLAAYGRSLAAADDERVADWALTQLDQRAVRAIVAAAATEASPAAPTLFAASVERRDDLVRLLMHGGFVATFSFGVHARRGAGWLVQFAEAGAVDATVRIGDGARLSGGTGRTWCFDMSSAPHIANDGFVVVRRVQRVARQRLAQLTAAVRAGTAPAAPAALAKQLSLAASAAAGSRAADCVTVRASLPTIQGNCFDGVTAIVFVVAISEYDLMLYEDQSVRRMDESMKLFDEMCNSQIFTQTPLVLFLNKSDLFREKIKVVDLSVCFPEYKGGADFERACAFTKAKFESLNKQPLTKSIYPHVTCATDTEAVSLVFAAVKDTLLTQALRES